MTNIKKIGKKLAVIVFILLCMTLFPAGMGFCFLVAAALLSAAAKTTKSQRMPFIMAAGIVLSFASNSFDVAFKLALLGAVSYITYKNGQEVIKTDN